MHAMKRIFRYLKGQPTLGLWYPKDLLMDLIAYSDSDYAGASIDRKSTIREYIAASNCYGQVLWLQNQLLDYGYNFMKTKIHVDNESAICVVKNPVYHSKTKHIGIRHHFIRDSYEKKLIEMVKIHTDYNVVDLLTKAFDVTRISKIDCLLSSEVLFEGRLMMSIMHSNLVNQLTNKVGSLENELKNTKKVYGAAITKLAKRVKKLEKQVKTGKASRRTKIVLLEDDAIEEDSSKQGRSLIEELDMDVDISLVPPNAEIQEKISDEIEVLLEEEEATEIVQDQGSGEKGEQVVSTADTELKTANIPISTTSETPEVSTPAKSLVYIRSEKKKKDKGKAIIIKDESVPKKSKKQEQEEKIGHEEAVRLQEQIHEEERKRIPRDAEIAKQLQEEYDKVGKKEAVTKVDTSHIIDWNDPSVIRYPALQNRPRSEAGVRKNMMVYLKNRGGYKMKDFKGMSYDDIRPIFEKVWDQIHSIVPMDSEEEVPRLKRVGQDVEAKPAKRQRTEEVLESVQEQTDEELKTDELSQEQLNQMKGQDIFMLVEKEYPLTKGLATLMLVNKLRVDQHSEMVDELLAKIYNIANKPRN
ncbi:hypothetical protein Tco_0993472 [Tanacetum coccineum]